MVTQTPRHYCRHMAGGNMNEATRIGSRANPAVVLGMFDTGLAVGRSLGRAGIRVIGLDFSKKVGFYSKYIDAYICPNPSENEKEFAFGILNKSPRSNYFFNIIHISIFAPL